MGKFLQYWIVSDVFHYNTLCQVSNREHLSGQGGPLLLVVSVAACSSKLSVNQLAERTLSSTLSNCQMCRVDSVSVRIIGIWHNCIYTYIYRTELYD
jgi:hypothetical protein